MDIDIHHLRKAYAKLAGKYDLPGFDELNEGFEIAKIDRDVGTLLRAVRKTMMEKIVNSLSFVEMLLNPVGLPRMYMAYVKVMSVDDKKKLDGIYSELSTLSLLSLEREIEYSEKGEAELINKVCKVWNSVNGDFVRLLGKIRKPRAESVKKERSYFG